MKTLSEIIDEVRDGGRPDYEDLRYAICAMAALQTFTDLALQKLAIAQQEGRKPVLSWDAQWQYKENFERMKRALAKPPKEYIGWDNDPDNPEFLERRKAAQQFMTMLFKEEEK